MKRKLFAVCPRCGARAEITKTFRNRDGEPASALVKCGCTAKPQQVPYSVSRVMKVDLIRPSAADEMNHYDLLLPPGWTEDMWIRLHAFMAKCRA